MAMGENPQAAGEPYSWDENTQPPPETRKLWQEVATGIDTTQTVVWKNAVESLDAANRYLVSTEAARRFVEGYMRQVIGILVEQQPAKIGQLERTCVEESLELSVMIIAKDIKIQQKRNGECQILEVLSSVFNRKKAYYKGSKGSWNVNHLSGLPEVRMRMIDRFRHEGGFSNLAAYLKSRISTPLFPPLELVHQILSAIGDAVGNRGGGSQDNPPVSREVDSDALLVTQAVMDYISSFSEESLRKQPPEMINTVRFDLQRVYDRLVSVRRQHTYRFYDFWRGLILKMITSQSLPLRLTGWEQLKDLIEASADHRPPPRRFAVSGAGCSFVNGIYQFTGGSTEDGYAQRGVEISYERKIPDEEKEGGGKKLTLFRCTMRSQQKWWFLSEADEEQPGTDRDIDYYQHKSKEHEETEPPPRGWLTCRNAGVDPPPNLRGMGLMVPEGEEYSTLEHQLAQWAIENQIVELILGASLHREVVHRSIPLIEFLGSMCERDAPVRGPSSGVGPNAYCLKTSHLFLAWKTCTSKADAAVSEEIYHLLVSILPSLPNSLAIPLLQAVESSLKDTKRDYLFEATEFCSALASSVPSDTKSGALGVLGLSEEVRSEVLTLLWDILTHPDASSLKTYETLKRYVATELHVEPFGQLHREAFLDSCTKALVANAKYQSGGVDEMLALRMVKLTQFVLEACPKEQAGLFATADKGALATLIFDELTAYLTRRKAEAGMSPIQKKVSTAEGSKLDSHEALSERLRILRCVYGLAAQVKLTSSQLRHLWQLCTIPSDREELMVFIANASSIRQMSLGPTPNMSEALAVQPKVQHGTTAAQADGLGASFSDEVRTSAFLDLFCSTSVNWGELGERAYQSFQVMFKRLRQSPGSALVSSGPSLDALWRICLTAGYETVASQAMKDLLAVYAAMATVNRTQNAWTDGNSMSSDMQTGDEDDFGTRVFDCLVEVKRNLDAGDVSSERSAERCLRILNAAVGQESGSGRSIASLAVSSLTSLGQECSLSDVIGVLPHGMRGQSCYRRIGIMAKRTASYGNAGQGNNLSSLPVGESSTRNPVHRFSLDVHPLETLASIKSKVGKHCQCRVSSVKPISANGRLAGGGNRSGAGEHTPMSLSVVPDESTVDQLGILSGCELVFVIADRQTPSPALQAQPKPSTRKAVLELGEMFSNRRNGFADRMFQTLLSVLEALRWRAGSETHKLVWDLLLAIPTNPRILEEVRLTAGLPQLSAAHGSSNEDEIMVDMTGDRWSSLLNKDSFHRSVYVLQTVDTFLQPAPEVLSILSQQKRADLEGDMKADASAFRKGYIESGGFDAAVKFFSSSDGENVKQSQNRMGNAAALRILKCCLFGNTRMALSADHQSGLDDVGSQLLSSLSSESGLLRSLTAMVVGDEGISMSTISDVLKFLRLLFRSSRTTQAFVSLPDGMAEKFLITLLLWEGSSSRSSSSVGNASKVRRNTHDLILSFPVLARYAFPWLIASLDAVDVRSDASSEYFDVLKKLVGTDDEKSASKVNSDQLRSLGTAVCRKLLSCPRPTSDSSLVDVSTGVLCGCLKLLRALIENGGGAALSTGTAILLKDLGVTKWSQMQNQRKSVMALVGFQSRPNQSDAVLIDLMGVIFDGYLSPGGSSSVVSICCDKESRQLGFEAVAAAARSCTGSDGYKSLVNRINGIVESAAPFLRHRWGQFGGNEDAHSRSPSRNPSKYSGLRNQGCTCYMNSFLQQLFMMPELRNNMCEAPLPDSLRSSGGNVKKGQELVGQRIALQWDSGASYDAVVESYDEGTSMHTVRYCPLQIASVGATAHQDSQQDELARMPPELPDEFILTEGRPGKETGVFEIISEGNAGESSGEGSQRRQDPVGIEESEDESSARHLFEEVQRTFIHLDEGSRGRCFDPRALVEACACLKLEFDVWQQNDASEFAMKLLDRMEIALKRWAPRQFRCLEHTFGLKQTKQKICKECGLKTNREENLMSIDCQIRGKTDIHEALDAMCDVEYMEGNNKVFCDRCKKNTDTVLRTAISALPDMLILSLKRFDLDYNTFETVKLNSRCAFGHTLNMKQYTLDGLEASDKGSFGGDNGDDPSPMDTEEGEPSNRGDAQPALPDEDYEYQLAGVLVHAGVAQGGHYYSFIKDRSSDSPKDHRWYRFDDEDVTPFDPSQIEVECFGGKVKKESKWPNGQVHTVESEQFANALMVFYEKVKPVVRAEDEGNEGKDSTKKSEDQSLTKISGYDAFEPDVRRSNATHKWQTFLFDSEFQTFLKGLLGLCRLSRSPKKRDQETQAPSQSDPYKLSWQSAIVDMLLSFFLDVLLYSVERPAVDEWVRMLEETLQGDRESARQFVHKLARRTQTVSSNWLRTYASDCPEAEARSAAVRIFAAALSSCAAIEDEIASLRKWCEAWTGQLREFKTQMGSAAIPTALEGKWIDVEDLKSLQNGSASGIGVIISYITRLLEVAPRTWKYNFELCMLIRDLSNVRRECGGDVLREALNLSQIPARLICLVVRDKAPPALKASFPGASVSFEVAETQMRQETNPSPHLLPLSGNQIISANDMSSRGGGSPVAGDFVPLFEALGRIIGMEGLILAPLVVEAPDQGRNRPSVVLTEEAKAALVTVFKEACGSDREGLGQHEVELYLQRCGLDSTTVPRQSIVEIFNKYETSHAEGTNAGDENFLSLQGFLAYYRDIAQTNESRVRSDLHAFGFRPDLSRRPKESRVYTSGGREQLLSSAESVASDVGSKVQNVGEDINGLAMLGLDVFLLYQYAFSACEPLAEYLLATTAYERDSRSLIVSTLKSIYRAPTAWAGNDTWSAGAMVLRILAAIDDGFYQERIQAIMQNSRTGMMTEQGLGLLVAAKAFAGSRNSQNYSTDMQYAYERYVEILKDLLKLRSVFLWMSEHRALWSWMERDLFSNDDMKTSRRPYDSGRRDGTDDEEDDDSRMIEDNPKTTNEKVIVANAGLGLVNGVYRRDGNFESAGKYARHGKWKGSAEVFSLFLCNVSNNTKHWYISIVPAGVQPGTNADIDFYSAPMSHERPDFPPTHGWTKAQEGVHPPPTITITEDEQEGDRMMPRTRDSEVTSPKHR